MHHYTTFDMASPFSLPLKTVEYNYEVELELCGGCWLWARRRIIQWTTWRFLRFGLGVREVGQEMMGGVEASFEPQLIQKYQTRLEDFEDKIYGVCPVSKTTTSAASTRRRSKPCTDNLAAP